MRRFVPIDTSFGRAYSEPSPAPPRNAMTDLDAAVGDARAGLSSPGPVAHPLEPTARHLDQLLFQLTVDSSATRCAAVNGLARSPHAPFFVEPLIALLDDDSGAVRKAATSALAENGDARALAPLGALMKGSGSLSEDAGRAIGRLEHRLARRVDAHNSDASQAIQTAREVREAIAVRKLRLRAKVQKGVRLKLASLLLWATGLALFGIGVAVSGGVLAIVAGIALGLSGFALMEYADRYMPAEGLREYVACCDPDYSQSWAVGIALGAGLDGGGGGLDG